MKISIITPVYNDESTVLKTIKSLEKQEYENWEHIIVNDGSIDNSFSICEQYIKKSENRKKYKLINQENKDQLNAVLAGSKYVNGDIVFILHSDDMLPSSKILNKILDSFKVNPDVDALIGDLNHIDDSDRIIKRQIVRKYRLSKQTLVAQLLNQGRNQYIDVAFYRRDIFESTVKQSYLMWNIPFWISDSKTIGQLNVKNVDFPVLDYRVHSENYINNEMGKFNVLNGELRTLVTLMKHFNTPLYQIQNFLLRAFRKIGLDYSRWIVYSNFKMRRPLHAIELTIGSRYDLKNINNVYLENLILFYKNSKNRTIVVPQFEGFTVYYGKDSKQFFTDLTHNNLHPLYQYLLEEMQHGFTKVSCVMSMKNALEDIFKFLCIDLFIEIEVR